MGLLLSWISLCRCLARITVAISPLGICEEICILVYVHLLLGVAKVRFHGRFLYLPRNT